MTRATYVLFGAAVYVVFLATFVYLIAFVGDAPWLDVTVDHGGTNQMPWLSALIDLGLIVLFGVQHSVMARPAFKRTWTRIVPTPIERSVYVLFASAALTIMFITWRPIPTTVWDVTNPAASAVIYVLFGLGWSIVLVSSNLLGHAELFGLKQVWSHARGVGSVEPNFRTPFFYRVVRHPLYAGFIIAFWAIPRMSAGHLLLAATMFVYVLIAIRHEERDLVSVFGDRYEEYRQRVGTIAPRLGRTRS
jgi:methanethiol S-methyltransferase